MSFETSFTVVAPPMGKPRATHKDRFNPSEAVERYRTWADLVRIAATGDPNKKLTIEEHGDFFAIFSVAHIQMPKSWSQKKKDAHAGMIHRSTPDEDNINKGLKDALFERDERIAIGQCIKLWCYEESEPRCDVFLLSTPRFLPTKKQTE